MTELLRPSKRRRSHVFSGMARTAAGLVVLAAVLHGGGAVTLGTAPTWHPTGPVWNPSDPTKVVGHIDYAPPHIGAWQACCRRTRDAPRARDGAWAADVWLSVNRASLAPLRCSPDVCQGLRRQPERRRVSHPGTQP